jgi:hypothetical protein
MTVTPSVKRMRLGTKSCSECRRRKVRCIVREGQQECQECISHGSTCRPQGANESTPQLRSSSEVQDRLGRLEDLFRTLCDAVNPNLELRTNADFEEATGKLLGLLRRPEFPPSPANMSSVSVRLRGTSEQNMSSHHSDESMHPQHAPLIGFVREALMTNGQSGLEDSPSSYAGTHEFMSAHKTWLKEWVPRPDSLTSVLQHTERYWALWPLHPTELRKSNLLSISVISIAKSFIDESTQSDSPAVVAKVLVWLALCLQQFPREFEGELRNLPSSPSDLVFVYLNQSDKLLSLDSDSGGSIPALECLVLQSKCYINMGRPRRAWSSIRRAFNSAIILGLHQPVQPQDPGHANIWATIWRYDRQLSLVLGFPHALSEPHPSLLDIQTNASLEAKLLHRISIVCGHVIERNQNYQSATYSATMKLDEEMEDVASTIPPGWWTIGWDNVPLEIFYGRESLKLYLYHVKTLIHLPYMVKAYTHRICEYSRAAVLEASEGMIQSYRDARHHPDGPSVTCFLLDFHAFNAGLVLATDLISQHSFWDPEVEEQKWNIILGLVTELKRTATLLGFEVTAQAAQLLEHLYEARHGTYDGPEIYEATVPYFGKVCIRRPEKLPPLPRQAMLNYQPLPSIELSSNLFNYQSSPQTLPETELSIDWTAILNENVMYDWNGVFDFNEIGTL